MKTARRNKRLRNDSELKAAVMEWAARIKARPKQIRIQRMPRKWASCSSLGRITFNSELLAQPYRFQEFVIVHELLHLKIPNHGKLFKSLLSAHLPGWKTITRRAVLRSDGRHNSGDGMKARKIAEIFSDEKRD